MHDHNLPDIDIGRWARCEYEALHGSDAPRAGRTTAALEVARVARALLAGADPDDCVIDDPIQCDATTPRIEDIVPQAEVIATWVSELMSIEGLTPGTGDTANREDGTLVVVRVVTGSEVGMAWLALGQRVAAVPEPEDEDLVDGCLIHVPRVRLDRDTEGTLTIRDGDALVRIWLDWQGSVLSILNNELAPLRRPGHHCARCRLECGVRP